MSEKSYRNYLEHDERVKALDGIFSHSQDWQWFIENIEVNFDLADVDCWAKFQTKINSLSEVYKLFIQICRVCNSEIAIENGMLNDIYWAAKYWNGSIDKSLFENNIKTAFGKVLFLVVWLAKLVNADNNTDYIYDLGMLNTKNYWLLVKLQTLDDNRDDIEAYSSSISFLDWELTTSCLCDNLNHVEHPYSVDFFDRFGSQLYHADAFNFQLYNNKNALTWEEQYLLDMTSISIEDKKLLPKINNSAGEIPDQSKWTEEVIAHLLIFFSHPIASFVLETVRYCRYNIVPSDKTILAHCQLLTEYVETQPEYKVFTCSSFNILSSLFKDDAMRPVLADPICIKLTTKVTGCTDPKIIQRLKDAYFPVSREQKKNLKKYAVNLYHSIDAVSVPHEFIDYVTNQAIRTHITNEYLLKCETVFEQIATKDERAVFNLFYEYMVFLINVRCHNSGIDKQLIQNIMIHVQQLWQNEYYEPQLSQLQEFKFSRDLDAEQLEAYNEEILSFPLKAAVYAIPATEESLIELMEEISSNPISLLFKRMTLSRLYPVPDQISFVRHDVDNLYNEYIGKILETKGYKFINALKPEEYVQGVLEHIDRNIMLYAGALKLEKLYERVKAVGEKIQVDLIDFSLPLKTAHIAQLFPLLENKARELAFASGIFPFKESEEDFMQYKDPSSLLREIIAEIYSEADNFELIPDILFIYHAMYNSNSLNIRNECIHGRKYCSPQDLPFAIRVTCLSILMLEQRLQLINENITEQT